MRYTYDVYEPDPNLPGTNRRVETTTRLEEILSKTYCIDSFVKVFDNLTGNLVTELRTGEQFDEWMSQQDHAASIASQHLDKVYKKPGETQTSLDRLVEEIGKTHKPQLAWDPFNERESEIHMKGTTASAVIPDEIVKAVDPDHYQNFVSFELLGHGPVSLQWIEAEFLKPQFRDNPEAIKGALLFQIDKYLSRLGKKDAKVQELKKARWYMNYLIAFESNGNRPLFVKDIKAFTEK
jgi:hypothetical protein